MTKKTPYDFEFLTNEIKEEEDAQTAEQERQPARPNYHIIRCCGNCKFFWYQSGKSRRGYCKQPYPKERTPDTKRGHSYDINDIKTNWLHTHTTNSCDLHQFQSKNYSIGKVSQWVNKLFNADGTLAEEDL